MKQLIDELERRRVLSKGDYVALLNNITAKDRCYLTAKARTVADRYFGKKIYKRGLIEFTNYCQNDCYYCGIRKSNRNVERYRLTKEEILACCRQGYALGFRTFVLQGGEDPWYTEARMLEIIAAIRKDYPDCAITLSIGEKSYEEYRRFFQTGANRFLLRHETANPEHFGLLHPAGQSLANRKRCLADLKSIGYQVGTGIMVGSPYQTTEHLAEDLLFMYELQPQMIGIGPFIPHQDTIFAGFPVGSLDLTLSLIGILRLMFPDVLIPATTALGTIHPKGRELGILAGANVVMPNLSPVQVRSKYLLYDNKICTGEEAAECSDCLQKRLQQIGYEMVVDRGDYRKVAQVQ